MVNRRDLQAELGIYRRLAAARLRGQMQYRTSFALQLAGYFGIQLTELAALFILFAHFQTLGGWRLGEILFLYAISGLSMGVAQTFAAGFSTFSGQIVRGEFDRLLVRPVGTMLQVLASELQLHRLGRTMEGVVALVLALRLADVEWTAGRVLYLPVVLLSASLVFLAIFALEATICFWTTEATEVVSAFTYGGSELVRYPLPIFDVWLRRLFLFVVPLGFVVYAPSLYLLDKPDSLGLPTVTRFLAPVVAVAFALLAGAAWQAGVRRYRSTGT